MSLVEHFDEIQKLVAAGVGAVGGAFLMILKARKESSKDGKDIAASDATKDVIELLRQEVARLSRQNAALAELVNQLQIQVIALRRENSELDFIKRTASNLYGSQTSQSDPKRS